MSLTLHEKSSHRAKSISLRRVATHTQRTTLSPHQIKVTSSSGDNIPCRRSNKNWLIFTIPRDTHIVHLEKTGNATAPLKIKEALLFIEGRAIPIPIDSPTLLPTSLHLPAIPHWVGNALCICPEQNTVSSVQE